MGDPRLRASSAIFPCSFFHLRTPASIERLSSDFIQPNQSGDVDLGLKDSNTAKDIPYEYSKATVQVSMDITLLCDGPDELEICASGFRNVDLVLHAGPLGIVLSMIEILMVSVFWILNSHVDGNDFIKAYVTTLMVPLSGSSVTKFWSIVNSVAGVHRDYGAYGQIGYFIANSYGTLKTATQLFVMMGTVALMVLLIATALQQKRIDDTERTWLGFATILIVALTLGSLNYFMDPPYRGIPKFITTLVIVCSSAVLIVLLASSLVAVYLSSRKCSSKDMALADAWNRLVFAIAASLLALIPCGYSLWHYSVHYLTRDTTADDDARAEWLLRTVQFFTGLMIPPTILLFRPYKSACVSFCKSACMLKFKVRKSEKKTSTVPLNLNPPPQLTYAPVPPFAKVRNPEIAPRSSISGAA